MTATYGARRDDPATLSVTTLAPEPSPDTYRARCLLALSLVNQRATDAGLCWADAATVKGALEGVWDERP